MKQDSGTRLSDVLNKVIAEQHLRRFRDAVKEASENGWSLSLVGFSGSKFYSAGHIYFPEPIPRSIEKFRHVPLSARTNIKYLYNNRGRVAVVSLIKSLNRECTLKEAIDFADYCINE